MLATCAHCGVEYLKTKDKCGTCGPCKNRKQREWRAKRKSEGRPVISGNMSREYHARYEKAYLLNPENRRRKSKWMSEYSRLPEVAHKVRARMEVRNALRRGEIHRMPCEKCGSNAEAHHEDYSKPLEIVWMCRKHHLEHHAKAEGR